jgi:glycosyltransferase involved in cell wall biosynthesis
MDSSLPAVTPQHPTPELSIPDVPIDVRIDVSIIIPARNEEAAIGDCLQSLASQTGVTFEIILVDDASTDRTSEIAQSFSGVRVISPDPMVEFRAGGGRTGKNNAVIAGARQARANWLLFTDADTVHLPGSLSRAMAEAETHHADLLSYSPEQVVVAFAERAVMPVVFAELAKQYPPHKVRDQNSGIVAANGQYILVRRSAYEAIGGHAAVAIEILEDVALARLFRDAGYSVYFRYAADAVRTRMYRDWQQLCEGWTKNLALLFPHPGRLALQSMAQWLVAWIAIGIAFSGALSHRSLWILSAALWLLVYRRIRIAHFTTENNFLAIAFGLPVFAYLLLRSKKAHAKGQVSWKGRTYNTDFTRGDTAAGIKAAKRVAQIRNQALRTES